MVFRIRKKKVHRRQFLHILMSTAFCGLILQPLVVEPYWLKIKRLNISNQPSHRVVHITDIHYKGNRAYLKKVVKAVNALSPKFVCFSGDLVEDAAYVNEALEILSSINYPVYGVPGNHDYWSGASFEVISDYCKSTGGAWLIDQDIVTQDGKIQIIGATGNRLQLPPLKQELKRLLLVHYPLFADEVNGSFNLVLAGHSHGGQIRIPLLGALALPNRVGTYDLGLYQTEVGPLYVNPGIGTLYFPIRFWCRPQIAVIEI